jgi:hypothetical protein
MLTELLENYLFFLHKLLEKEFFSVHTERENRQGIILPHHAYSIARE